MDEPLSQYMSEFQAMQVRQMDTAGKESLKTAENPILIGQLFTMTGGFSYEIGNPSVLSLYQQTGGNFTMREYAKAFANESLMFEPGTRWNYSVCHDILGALIEVLSGQTLGIYLKEHIFDPLGMKDTFFRVPEEKKHRLASLYQRDEKTGILQKIDMSKFIRPGEHFENGGGGLITTVDDYGFL